MELYVGVMILGFVVTTVASLVAGIENESWRAVIKTFSIGSVIAVTWPIALPCVILLGLFWAIKDRSLT